LTPVDIGGRTLQWHFVPLSSHPSPWCRYVERWLRVIAAWPMQTSFVAGLDRINEALRQSPNGEICVI
jgi:hypothetical protein